MRISCLDFSHTINCVLRWFDGGDDKSDDDDDDDDDDGNSMKAASSWHLVRWPSNQAVIHFLQDTTSFILFYIAYSRPISSVTRRYRSDDRY